VPEFGTSFSLPDQVGYLRAAEIILLGHPFDAPTALNLGLVTKVLPDAEVLGSAEKIAQVLAQKPLAALKASKQLLRRQPRVCFLRFVILPFVQSLLLELVQKGRDSMFSLGHTVAHLSAK
jgi:enoyl-CoA hydratase/carnithine racemase